MKAVILAGGFGTRISEETELKPKPMIEIGGKPILWHIMKIYSKFGINDFIICCGYRGYVIKDYFKNYFLHQSDVTFDLKDNTINIHDKKTEPWKVTLVETGESTMTAGRLKKIYKYVKDDKIICLTYGDGLSNVNISSLIKFHKKSGKELTLTAVKAPGRYGNIKFGDKNIIKSFHEKSDKHGGWINGGFFVLNTNLITKIKNNNSVLETDILEKLVKKKKISAFKHYGFWQSMDKIYEKKLLNTMWEKNKAPWKIWI